VLERLTPAGRAVEAKRRDADEAFDRQYGVETGGIVRPKSDEVVGDNWAYGGNYQAVDPSAFMEAVLRVPISYADFTFIDFGSGKGRSLLLASQLPFKKVIGVEYCPQLNEVARRNIERFPEAVRKCHDMEAIDADATEYDLPDGPLLLFMNHPFAESLMAKVVKNVADSFTRNPRRIVVLYFTPNFAHLWEQESAFYRIQSTPALFDTGPVAEPSREMASVSGSGSRVRC
jgi:SAM-dependent methyltransferase